MSQRNHIDPSLQRYGFKEKKNTKNSINNSEIISFPIFLLGTVQYSDVKWFDKPFQNDLHNPLNSHTVTLKTLHIFFRYVITELLWVDSQLDICFPFSIEERHVKFKTISFMMTAVYYNFDSSFLF